MSTDLSVWNVEILVTPGLEFCVVPGVVLITNFLQVFVEPLGINLVKVVGGEVTTASKPPMTIFLTPKLDKLLQLHS